LKKFGISYKEKLKKKRDFEKIFEQGSLIFSFDKKIKAVYTIEKDSDQPGVKIAAAVSSKSGIAVWRNRVKRLIKESYRLNKTALLEICTSKNILLKIIFSPYQLNQKNNKHVNLKDIMPGVLDLMIHLKSII
jgi:ribonuclease P protein component